MRIASAVTVMLALFLFPHTVMAGEEKGEGPKPAVVPVFSLNGPITEAPVGEDFLFGSMGVEPLKDLIARMKRARDDSQVKAVVLLIGDVSMGYGQVEELRRVMDEIKSAGKKIYVHADGLTLGQYVLASGASEISLVPTGPVMMPGMILEELYLRGLLDKIGVKPDFMTCGAYKSAAETFMRDGPSDEAHEMMNWLVDGLFDTSVRLIAEGRGVEPKQVRQWIDGALYTAEKAKEKGIVDKVQYRQDFVAGLKKQYGEEADFNKKFGKKKRDELDLSSPFGLIKLWAEIIQGPGAKKPSKDSIAIVYVDGAIMPGQPTPSPFGSSGIAYSTPIRKALDEAAKDDTVKGVVLRVDSPGGSAVASEIILNATKRVKSEKPFVVSMGDVAGSGGYYVACGADTIFVDSATITASIGVVSGKFATTDMWNKIGITWKAYKRGANAGLLGSDDVFSDSERARMRELMTDIYEAFKAHVVAIRGDRLKKDIDDLAGGRVFTGTQALELGLVDKLGGLDDAIKFVAKQAKLDEYEIRVIPRPKNFMEILLSDLGDGEEDDDTISIASTLTGVGRAHWLLERALPHLKGLDPQRLDTVRLALQQLNLLQEESVILTMPVFDIGQ
jgi:protease-4